MKKIEFMVIGIPKTPAFRELERIYLGKITHYVQASIHYLKDRAEKDLKIRQKKESALILEALKPGDLVILCDERGTAYASPAFAAQLRRWQERAQRVVFVIGGAYGVDDALREKAVALVSLSPFPLPHELARTVLLEQVYRGLTILAGENYHHE